jgi:cobalt/nickel transport system permease protein
MCQPELIPSWLLQNERSLVAKTPQRLNFLRRSITHLSKIFNDEIYFNRTANHQGLLQALDPRAKLILTLIFMIIINCSHTFTVPLILFAITLIYAKLSHISSIQLIQRAWLIIPVFILICSIPALFNILIPGKALLTIISANSKSQWFSHGLYITDNGFHAVMMMFIRSGCSLSLVYLLLTTTSWNDLTKGLSLLKVPTGFILILSMTYRYIFLLANCALQMNEARFLRTVGRLDHRENRRFIGHSMALLFIKSNYLATEIFAAMRARGFSHKIVSLKILKLGKIDYIFMINNGIILLILLAWSKIS